MPIILAIEPDRRQAAHLTALVHRRVKAELILVPTTEGALDAIGNRVPDLVLVPALLSPQDDAALAAALRVIAAAAHVQMLTIPVLGPPRPAAKSGGVLSALRRDKSRSAEPDGCDPAVFAEQIASYLEQAVQERVTSAPAADVVHDEPLAATASAAISTTQADEPVEDVSEWAQDEKPAGGDESVSFALEEVARALFSDVVTEPESTATEPESQEEEFDPAVIEAAAPPAPAPEVPVVAAASEAVSDADAEWATVEQLIAALQLMPLAAMEATEADEWIAPVRDPENVAKAPERELDEPDASTWPALDGLVAEAVGVSSAPAKRQHTVAKPETPSPSARSEQEWVSLVESLRHDVERIRTERADKPAPRPAPPPSSRPRTAKPVQDEWGLFDPEQCGFAALLAKLEEVTEDEKSTF